MVSVFTFGWCIALPGWGRIFVDWDSWVPRAILRLVPGLSEEVFLITASALAVSSCLAALCDYTIMDWNFWPG